MSYYRQPRREHLRFKDSGAQQTINAMLQAQQRGQAYHLADLGTATSGLGNYLANNPNPAGKGSIAGPTTTTPGSIGGGPVTGSKYNPNSGGKDKDASGIG